MTDRLRKWFVPRTRSGWWAAGLSWASFILIATGILVASIQGPRRDTRYETPLDNLPHAVPAIGGLAVGLAAGVVAVIALFRYRDRTVPAVIALGLGVVMVWFLIGDVTGSN